MSRREDIVDRHVLEVRALVKGLAPAVKVLVRSHLRAVKAPVGYHAPAVEVRENVTRRDLIGSASIR